MVEAILSYLSSNSVQGKRVVRTWSSDWALMKETVDYQKCLSKTKVIFNAGRPKYCLFAILFIIDILIVP